MATTKPFTKAQYKQAEKSVKKARKEGEKKVSAHNKSHATYLKERKARYKKEGITE
ncbi:MAG TPA: hypothetical protein VIJ14_08075 [Rhabdochlamydiaceae bacterium]